MNNVGVFCFYFPSRGVSGVPVLFSRIALALSRRASVKKVYVVDFVDGYIAESIKGQSKIELIPFNFGKSVYIPDDVTFITQAMLPYRFPSELVIPATSKIVFWNLHPDNLVPVLIPFPGLRNIQFSSFNLYEKIGKMFFKRTIGQVKTFASICLQKNALLFMDSVNRNKTAQYLFLDILNNDFLPVPALNSDKRINHKDNSDLTFCWVGRLCDFKIHILLYTIDKLTIISKELKIKIKYKIIGDGPFRFEIDKLDLNNEFFELEMLGAVSSEKLDDILINEVDILTAMGTSALEGAKFALPTIVLDFSYAKIVDNYKYRWLYNTEDFDLGHNISSKDFDRDGNSLKQIILESFHNYSDISNKTLDYFLDNHSIDGVVEKLILATEESNLKITDFPKSIFKKSLIRNLYEVFKKK
ncbi:hypothetical protein SRABI27_04672 [Pedobacter sp. Bi27]|uniref:hypothetical protein n=1 Tax=Pedobacter sp. Bi27 TaxID=2822351 RepID=UPI001D459530|nr:hypothetical protein [Pedobacter sp. Bi27]CAH0308436.1 hypothetical protein SRABI27_04672 [Pedobacter sp. Bi27]